MMQIRRKSLLTMSTLSIVKDRDFKPPQIALNGL